MVAVLVLAALLTACGGRTDDIRVGVDAPDFTLQSARGETVSLSDYRGQPVLLYFHMAVG